MVMEQFNEWWLLEAQNIIGVGRGTEKDAAETAWKAACEYWLEVAKEHDQEMQFMIEKELYD